MGPHDVEVDQDLTPAQRIRFIGQVKTTRPKMEMVEGADGTAKAVVPAEAMDTLLLNEEQSSAAHDTHIHSLQLLEYMILSGELSVKEMLDATKTLAEYQFMKASQRKKHQSNEKTVEDYLQEIEDQFQSEQ